MKKLLALLLAFVLILGLAACGTQTAEPTTTAVSTTAPAGLSAEEQAILQERRDTAEAYMRSMAADQMAWVQQMNAISAQVREIINEELILV